MPIFKLPDSDYFEIPSGSVKHKYFGISQEKYGAYSQALLGLGDLTLQSPPFVGICALFDLEGFTHFTGQRDSELIVSKFMSFFLQWFFNEVKRQSVHEETAEGYILWHKFPLMTKFLGDGFMVIWDTPSLTVFEETNIVDSCEKICHAYSMEFLPTINQSVPDAPQKLRCGVAKGKILTIGSGSDFIGPVVNLAARLQKLGAFSFAWASKGTDLDAPTKAAIKTKWLLIKVSIRGWDNTENVYVPRVEYESLSVEEKKGFLLVE